MIGSSTCMNTPTEDSSILTHPHGGVNVLGLLWALIGLFPAAILMATLDMSGTAAALLFISMLALSIVLDVRWRAANINHGRFRRFFALSSGGCLLWLPYWVSWFVLTPIVVIFSRGGVFQALKAVLESIGYYE